MRLSLVCVLFDPILHYQTCMWEKICPYHRTLQNLDSGLWTGPWTGLRPGLVTTDTSFLRQRIVFWRLDDSQITRYTLPNMTRVQICTCATIQCPHSWPCEKFSRSNLAMIPLILILLVKWSHNLSVQWACVQGSANGGAILYVLSQGSRSIYCLFHGNSPIISSVYGHEQSWPYFNTHCLGTMITSWPRLW